MNRAVVLAMMAAGACAGSLACSSAVAQGAENDEGFYLGGGVGQFNLKLDDFDQTDEAIEQLDDDDTAWKAFVGWRMNPHFALEVAYVDFGRPSDRFETSGSSGDFRADISGFEPSIVGTIPLGPVELFGKIGYLFYDVDASLDLDDGPDLCSLDQGRQPDQLRNHPRGRRHPARLVRRPQGRRSGV